MYMFFMFNILFVHSRMWMFNNAIEVAREGFNRHAPPGPGGIGAGDVRAAFAGIPRRHVAALAWRLAVTLLPWHRPDRVPRPAWAKRWCADYAAGCDMTRYYGQCASLDGKALATDLERRRDAKGRPGKRACNATRGPDPR